MIVQVKIPRELRAEFQTVTILLRSDCETRVVDSLIISCAKYEKQLRRIFVYLSRCSFNLSLTEIQNQIAGNKRLYPHSFIRGIERLSNQSISEIVGDSFSELNRNIEKLLLVRNKVIHGQVTGMQLSRKALMSHVQSVVDWMSALAIGSQVEFGFDGIAKNYPYLERKTSGGETFEKALVGFQSLLMALAKLDRRPEDLGVGNASNPELEL